MLHARNGIGDLDAELDELLQFLHLLLEVVEELEEHDPGEERQSIQIDSFLDVDGVGLEIVTRTLQPLIVRSSASNLHEICQFMASLSAAAAENPEGVARLAGRLSKIDPADRQTLATLARAAGTGGIAVDPIATEKLPAKLAARWIPARQLESERIR